MDDQSTCWRCGEPRDGGDVCELCGAVPARSRMRPRDRHVPHPPDASDVFDAFDASTSARTPTKSVAVPAGGSAGAALLGTLAPQAAYLPRPRPQDRVTGYPAPALPGRGRPSGRARGMLFAKIGLAAVASVAGIGGRIAARQLLSADTAGVQPATSVQEARSASDFSDACVTLTATMIESVDCGVPHAGRVQAIVPSTGACPGSTIDSMVIDSDPTRRICIGPG